MTMCTERVREVGDTKTGQTQMVGMKNVCNWSCYVVVYELKQACLTTTVHKQQDDTEIEHFACKQK